MTLQEEIHLQLDTPPKCARCDGEPLLLARFPSSWKHSCGEGVNTIRATVLCPGCDQGDPAAAELLALFAVDQQLNFANLEEFGGLVTAWVESVRHQKVDEHLLAEQEALWRSGKL